MVEDLQWHLDRQKGIGGSEASTVLGINPWQSRLELYHKKVDKILPNEDDDLNLIFDIGHALEPVIANHYAKITERTIETRPQKIHPLYPFINGNVDREIVKSNRPEPGVLEIKTKGEFIDWHGEEIPPYYMTQIQQYMAVGDYKWGSFAVLDLGSRKIDIIDVERDNELINIIIEAEKEFWNYNVLQKIPPEVESTEACESFLKETYKTSEPITIDISDNEGATWNANELNRAKNELKNLKVVELTTKNYLMDLMKNAELAIGNGYTISWKNNKDGTEFDMDKFKLDNPKLYTKYLEPKKGARVFRTKFEKE